jgi:dipeptidase D
MEGEDDGDRKDGEEPSLWLGARGTTLGADNGIGVAAILALLETRPPPFPPSLSASGSSSDLPPLLPPLEALFTVDEEVDFSGAVGLDAKALGLTGRTMLNLDSEDWGNLYIGCAGDGLSTLSLPLTRSECIDSRGVAASAVRKEVRVGGLAGGHSGADIHEGRANAVRICAAVARAALLCGQGGVQLVSLSGGDKFNAIPREARAVFSLSNADDRKCRVAFERAVQQCHEAAKAEYGALESNLSVTVHPFPHGEKDTAALGYDSAMRLVNILLALPHGPLKFSHAMPDLVETSNNLAAVAMDGGTATILCHTRSSIGTALESARDRVRAVATLAGATVDRNEKFPGWNPNLQSPLLRLAKTLLSHRLGGGATVGVKAIHAGLECGILIEKMGGDVDTLSLGPTIQGAHSPDEAVRIDTVLPFFDLVREILAELAKQHHQ